MAGSAGSSGAGAPAWLRRLAAPCEFVGVLMVSIVVQRWVLSALGIASWKGTQAAMLESGAVDFSRLARLAAIDQVLKYGVLLGLAFAIGWWHRGRRPSRYGLTRGGHGVGRLASIGVVLWAVSYLLPGLLQALDDHLPWIGRGPDHWALFPSTWSPEFLLYMAVSSFLLVPVVEELAVRGYLLTRLREEFGDAGALLLSSVFFALAHLQYFKLEVLSLGMLVSIVVGSLASGYVLIRTGSLIAPIVAHAIVNLPLPPGEWSEEIAFAVAAAVVAARWRTVAAWGRDLLTMLAGNRSWGGTLFGLGVLLAALAAALAFQSRLAPVAAALLAVGLVGDAVDRCSRAILQGDE